MSNYTFQSRSKNIESVEHDGESTLKVSFRSGRTYNYFEVPFEVFEIMEAIDKRSGSCNSHFNKAVRGVYEYEEAV